MRGSSLVVEVLHCYYTAILHRRRVLMPLSLPLRGFLQVEAVVAEAAAVESRQAAEEEVEGPTQLPLLRSLHHTPPVLVSARLFAPFSNLVRPARLIDIDSMLQHLLRTA